MAEVHIEGLDEWLEKLELVDQRTSTIMRKAIRPGAKIVADECRRRINALKVDNTLFSWNPQRKGITGGWKKALQESMGIAKLRHEADGWNVKLGFDGYSTIRERRGYRNGEEITVYNSSKNPEHNIPNAVIARTTESGTSNLPAQPFMSQTITATQANAEQVIGQQFIDELVNILGMR